MSRTLWLAAGGIGISVAMLAAGFAIGRPSPTPIEAAAPMASPEPAALDRPQVEAIVRDYLLANPEIMVEVQTALEQKRQEEQRVASLEVIKQSSNDIFNAAHDGVVGNPAGKVTIVEFYDYNCGYCKRAHEDMLALTAADPDLRFVLKEFPILGPDSQKAHVVSQAFLKVMPDRFQEFHDTLLASTSRATEASAIQLAVSLGADETTLRDAMADPAIQKAFEQTYELANKLAITGTPSYVVGSEVVFGALGKDVLAEKIAAARACGDKPC